MTLPQPYFELAYDVGLGGKNAQGFGMVEVVK
jgi:CRISPR-associated endoribonuclease Cas6